MDSLQGACGDGGTNRVYLYAREYISYGPNSIGLLTTRPTGQKEYTLADHLGSTRVVLDERGAVIGSCDNAPFGELVAVTGQKSRKGFIDKEVDQETASGNFGVRQYAAGEGRFTSVDPLWDKYPFETPYHYSSNNPLVIKGPSGLADNLLTDRPADAPIEHVHTYTKNIVDGQVKSVTEKNKLPDPTTQHDLRTVRNYLEPIPKPRMRS